MASDRWKAILEAREKLSAYIDALWAGRESAPDGVRQTYTERLAIAARLSTLLRYLHSAGAIRDLVRREN